MFIGLNCSTYVKKPKLEISTLTALTLSILHVVVAGYMIEGGYHNFDTEPLRVTVFYIATGKTVKTIIKAQTEI
jgi:hypothetical protein